MPISVCLHPRRAIKVSVVNLRNHGLAHNRSYSTRVHDDYAASIDIQGCGAVSELLL
jgi:hypothetical protein